MKKFVAVVLAIVLLLAIGGGIALIKMAQFSTLAEGEQPPQMASVSTVAVEAQSWPRAIQAVGSLSAVQGVMISPEVAGTVSEILFESGQTVEKGAILLRMDTATEKALLDAAEASAVLAEANLKRARQLRESGTISAAELDSAQAEARAAEAEVQNYREVINKKVLRAPFSGTLGIRQIDAGQYLTPGAAIVDLQNLDALHAEFFVPQTHLPKLKTGLTVEITSDALPGETFTGTLTAIEPRVDEATRNIRLQATVKNEGDKLRPGLYVNLAVQLPGDDAVLAVPATALAYATYGNSVFRVRDETDEESGESYKVGEQQFVKTGRTRGDFVQIVTGLEAGDVIVRDGVFKLRNNIRLSIDNERKPEAELEPKPEDR